jgi:hypothetical protein
MNKQLNSKYKTEFGITSAIVNEFDLCGLISGGAPNDEYDSLTDLILGSIANKSSHDETVEKIIQLLEDYFGYKDLIAEIEKQKLQRTLDLMLGRIKDELDNSRPNETKI